MVIKIIEDQSIWDKFVEDSPHGMLFHKWDFLKIMEKHTNYKLLPYGIYKGDNLICIFPLYFKNYKFIKSILSPPPGAYVSYLGFIMDKRFETLKQNKKENYLKMVLEDFNEEMKKIGPNYISVNLVANFLDVRQFKWNNYEADVNFTYIIDLCRPLEEIWDNFRKDLRREITIASRSNLKLVKSDDVSQFFSLEKKRYEEQGLTIPIINQNYIEDLLKKFPENLKIYYLNNTDNEIVSILLTCEYKDILMFWMGGAKLMKSLYSNEYMVWEFIKKAKNDGYKKFEWGAGPEQICNFKSQFNPSLYINFTIHKKDIFGKFARWTYYNLIKRKI